jgi:predicted component of type VI protein secretion system
VATLTLSFKGRLLSVHHLDERPTSIGRDPNCRIPIDSLAVAPRNAEVIPAHGDYLLLALDPDYPVLLNGEQVDQASLRHGDLIQLGKHTLSFSEDSLRLAGSAMDTPGLASTDVDPTTLTSYLQLQSGPQIGRIVVLRRSVTRLSHAGAADLIVTRREDGYHLSHLEGGTAFRVDGRTVAGDGEAQLCDGSLIEIGEVRLQFFTDGEGRSGA